MCPYNTPTHPRRELGTERAEEKEGREREGDCCYTAEGPKLTVNAKDTPSSSSSPVLSGESSFVAAHRTRERLLPTAAAALPTSTSGRGGPRGTADKGTACPHGFPMWTWLEQQHCLCSLKKMLLLMIIW